MAEVINTSARDLEDDVRLVRYREAEDSQLGVVIDDHVVPLESLAAKYPTMLSVIAGGDAARDDIQAVVGEKQRTVPLADVKLLAPLERPGKYLAIGMNYRKHLEEAMRLGVKEPTHQFWFNKQTTCIHGPYDDVAPGVSEELDYEVELAVVIGRTVKDITAEEAVGCVFGYMVANDLSARDWQRHSPTFTIGKSFDTHGPIGPWIVTADEIDDPHQLGLRCFVNGEIRQDGNTSELIHNVWEQIAYLSQAFTLEPGDLIATGTPSGVGAAMTPPIYLKAGDVVRCEVERIGHIENRVSDAKRNNADFR